MEDRRQRAVEGALASYTWLKDSDTTETSLIDLIADLLLYADYIGKDGQAILRMATLHYEEERS